MVKKTVSVKITVLFEEEEWQRWEGSRETRHAPAHAAHILLG